MSDLEIIKELEEEIGVSLEQVEDVWRQNNTYVVENENVTGVNVSGNSLVEIPDSLLKLKFLKTINLSYNDINSLLPLLELEQLESIAIQENKSEFSSESLSFFISQSKKLKTFNLNGSYKSPYFEKELLNHDFLLASRPYSEGEKVIYFDNYQYFPPFSLLELGYNDPKFYFDNYNEQWEEIVSVTNSLDKGKNSGDNIKQEIISELLNNYYSSFKGDKELSYAIRKLLIYDYQGINILFIDNVSIDERLKLINDPHWIFLTGENGYGKTSLLQGIVIGLFGREDLDHILTKSGTLHLGFKEKQKLCVNSIRKGADNVIPFQNFAAYGPARLNKTTRRNDFGRTYSLFNTDGELLDIEEQLAIWEKDENQKGFFDSAKKILLNLLNPQIKDLYVERKGTTSFVKYMEPGDNVGKEFSELASGYRSIIAMIGDIIIRLSENQPDIKDFTELAGIVIIDEIDLHLHPKWQKALVEKLTETFPKIQFIASTHSPIPLLGAPENTVIINVQRSEEKGITAEKLDIDFSTLTPNSILSSPIFGFEDLVPVSKPDDKFVNTEKDFKKIKAKEKTRKEIAKYLSPEKTDEFLNLLNDDGQ